MARVYIELGVYTGSSLASMIECYEDLDRVIGFEPIPQLFNNLVKKFGANEKVILYNAAAGIEDREKVKLYLDDQKTFIGSGSTLFSEKTSGKVSKDKFVEVTLIDFSRFVKENLSKDDYIIIRINIEGGEYDLLEHLIETSAIYYFNEMECHWHHDKSFKDSSRITKKRQDELIEKLEKIFDSLINKGVLE